MAAESATLERNPAKQGKPASALAGRSSATLEPDLSPEKFTPPVGAAVTPKSFAGIPPLAPGEKGGGRASAYPGPRISLQRKLTIGAVNDPLEYEADTVSDRVMRGQAIGATRSSPAVVHRSCACGSSGEPCDACKPGQSATLLGKAIGGVAYSEAPPVVHEVLSAPGEPLDSATRSFMEPRFGYDFSRVRVHNGPRAQTSARAVSANAYTVGENIVLSGGISGYAPAARQRLLAHELTHVVQQGAAAPIAQGGISSTKAPAAGRVATPPTLRRQAEQAASPPAPAPDLGFVTEAIVDAAALPAIPMGDSAHDMVRATFHGFAAEVETQAPARRDQLWGKVKELAASPKKAGLFALKYVWGFIKGVFSPITGLFDLAKLIFKLQGLPAQILTTAWKRRAELAQRAANIAQSLVSLQQRGADALAKLFEHPIDTLMALGPWLLQLKGKAIAAAEGGGHKLAAKLLSELDKEVTDLGEEAGDIVGTVLVNAVILFFTAGIGDAIVQVASKLGEFGAFLGEFGKAAQIAGKVATELAELLGTLGGWIAAAEAAFASAAETILRPIAPLLKELGNTFSELRAFVRELFGVAEKEAEPLIEGGAGAAARNLDKPPGPIHDTGTPPPTKEIAPPQQKPPLKEPVKEPVKEPAKEPTKEPNKESTKEGEGESDPAKGAADLDEDIHDPEPEGLADEKDLSPAICFPAGTLISTETGPVPIESLRPGDAVSAFDFASGTVVSQQIVGVVHGSTGTWVEIHAGAEVLRATRSHPFWVDSLGDWVAAEHLTAGMHLRRQDGGLAVIDRVALIPLEEPETTFNLSIESFENFFVGALKVLVHNIKLSLLKYFQRPGYSNYVLRAGGPKGKIYYSGMFGPGVSADQVQYRHRKNHNRFNPENDYFDLKPGTRNYGEARLVEHDAAVANKTIIGRDGENYRGNRQAPIAADKLPEYREFEEFERGCK